MWWLRLEIGCVDGQVLVWVVVVAYLSSSEWAAYPEGSRALPQGSR
ncbi:MAG TPA: hypothetical protein VF049_12120 [Nocardioidaceae bacterium]|jgi:hypothetical protein